MICILFVIYNKKLCLKTDFLVLDKSFYIVIFDNSIDSKIISFNKKYCSLYKLNYFYFGQNLGLSIAYNYVIKNVLKESDYLLLLDDDTAIDNSYLSLAKKEISKNPKCEIWTPINYDAKNGEINSPKKIVRKFGFFLSTTITDDCLNDDFLISINNGLLIKRTLFDKIGFYNENIFLYFSDSYFFFELYKHGIKTKIIPYRNICDFSFRALDKSQLMKKLSLMKKDGLIFYKIIYKELHLPLLTWIHYFCFSIRRAKECAHYTNKKYFFSFLFCRRSK